MPALNLKPSHKIIKDYYELMTPDYSDATLRTTEMNG